MNLDNLQLLHDKILVKIVKEEKTAGGIILTEANQERSQTGEVIAIGTGRLMPNGVRVPLVVQVGDIVFFAKHAGYEIKDDKYLFREDEILGIVKQIVKCCDKADMQISVNEDFNIEAYVCKDCSDWATSKELYTQSNKIQNTSCDSCNYKTGIIRPLTGSMCIDCLS